MRKVLDDLNGLLERGEGVARYRVISAGAVAVDHGVFLFALLPPGASETVYSRMFAPQFGIAEDAATGVLSSLARRPNG